MNANIEKYNFAIELLVSMQPEQNEIADFDKNSKDVIAAIEWGMKKQENMERAIYQKQIDRLRQLVDEEKLKMKT